MSRDPLLSRIRASRVGGVLVVYLASSWLVFEVATTLQESLGLPAWVAPVVLILLGVGLVVVLATAWVQSHPLLERREAADEVPDSWELDLPELGRTLRKGRLPHLTWARALVAGLVAFSLVVGSAGAFVLLRDSAAEATSPPTTTVEIAPAIAVLPFDVPGSGAEDLGEDLVKLLSTNLDGAGALRAIDSWTVLARWGETIGSAGRPDLATALEVARRTGARWALVGTAVSTNAGLRLNADVYEVAGARKIANAQSEGDAERGLYQAVDSLARRVIFALAREGLAVAPVDLAAVTTHSLAALKDFLRGERALRANEFEAATEAYEGAIAADSLFALAHYRLASARAWANEGTTLWTAPLMRALGSERLPRREALYSRALMAYLASNELTYLDSLQLAVRRYPDDAEAWYLLGETLWHAGRDRIADAEAQAEAAFSEAAAIDPGFALYQVHLVDVAFARADSAAATRRMERYAALPRSSAGERAALALAFGDSLTRARAWTALDTTDPGDLGRAFDQLLAAADYQPAYWPLTEALYERRHRVDPAALQWAPLHLAYSGFANRGRLETALEHAVATEPPMLSRCVLGALAMLSEGAVPDRVLEEAVARRGELPAIARSTTECDAALAALLGRWDQHARAEALQEVFWERQIASAVDSTTRERLERERRASLRFASAAGLWIGGHRQRAAELVQASPWPRQRLPLLIRARILLDGERWEDAVDALRAIPRDPLSNLYLGEAYEGLGELEEARDAYRYFLTWWSDADPELQPMVDRAVEGLARIQRVLN